MGSRWKKVKGALGLGNLCVYVPRTVEEDEEAVGRRNSVSSTAHSTPMTPTPTSSGLVLAKKGSRSSKGTCIICLGSMKAGRGHALFTAECSHTFHFHCIVSNVRHGNNVCPVCRANWKEIPLQAPSSSDISRGRPSRSHLSGWLPPDSHSTILRRLPRASSSDRQQHRSGILSNVSEPSLFNDDEPLELPLELAKSTEQPSTRSSDEASADAIYVKTVPEFSTVRKSSSLENFTILINLKAPMTNSRQNYGRSNSPSSNSQSPHAPVDLVTVLDVSGSMAGTKLALLKRAMSFVIQNLGPSDRLSVVAFSSTAYRLFNLRCMTESGRQHALQAVNSLISSGGTNIAEGLSKGIKVLDERKEKNPVCSIILLSDGQDTYNITSGSISQGLGPDYTSLLPNSVHIPIHTFGFGADHDAASMHSIAETSGGTFSFIEAENVIQDAFAQCIGGLLSVVVQDLILKLDCAHAGVQISSIKSGSYVSEVSHNGEKGHIDVGDLYADEERNFLVTVNVPKAKEENTVLLKIGYDYRNTVTNGTLNVKEVNVVIQRPEVAIAEAVSIEVDRQRNRLRAAEVMAEARTLAERGALSEAVSTIDNCRKWLVETPAGRLGDQLCVGLNAELNEMQERMANRQRYEESGRAYVLSGLSSHSLQRATARGDSTESHSFIQSYQTPSMVDMLHRSQTLTAPILPSNPPVRPTRSKHRTSSR